MDLSCPHEDRAVQHTDDRSCLCQPVFDAERLPSHGNDVCRNPLSTRKKVISIAPQAVSVCSRQTNSVCNEFPCSESHWWEKDLHLTGKSSSYEVANGKQAQNCHIRGRLRWPLRSVGA